MSSGSSTPTGTSPPREPEAQPWHKAKNKDWQNLRMEVYAAMIDNVDQNIGRILSAIKKSGEENNTLVLFLSDNGSCAESPGGENNIAHVPGPKEYYSHVGPSWAYAQNAPFRRYKSRMHEGGIATPLIAYWPKIIPKNSLTNQVGHIIDFLPTFLEIGNGSYPSKYKGQPILPAEGISLLSVLKSPSKTITRKEPLYWFYSGNRAIRDGDWKLVWDKNVKKWELYNLAEDRTEMHDLAEKKPVLVKRLRTQWEKWAYKTDVNYNN
ncbi:sulfatase-like hydrolase/transferase [Akkermansiaceae bacterium]|nr:sulfatase-like hydrolase/transferase [Akkermansiaceae bacterium]